ncbi:MAG: hypothetical protein LBT53_07955 [Puniceicoccales bacterium]|nr:hypothetical protein [Puniceicoccales bacterium]
MPWPDFSVEAEAPAADLWQHREKVFAPELEAKTRAWFRSVANTGTLGTLVPSQAFAAIESGWNDPQTGETCTLAGAWAECFRYQLKHTQPAAFAHLFGTLAKLMDGQEETQKQLNEISQKLENHDDALLQKIKDFLPVTESMEEVCKELEEIRKELEKVKQEVREVLEEMKKSNKTLKKIAQERREKEEELVEKIKDFIAAVQHAPTPSDTDKELADFAERRLKKLLAGQREILTWVKRVAAGLIFGVAIIVGVILWTSGMSQNWNSTLFTELYSIETHLEREDKISGQERTFSERREQAMRILAKRWNTTPEAVQKRIDKALADTENPSNKDTLAKSQAAYYKQRYPESERYAESFVREAIARYNSKFEAITPYLEAIFQGSKQLGLARAKQEKFDKAANAYREGLKKVTKENAREQWAELQVLLGNAESNFASRSEGTKIQEHRGNAIQAYRAALEVYTRQDLPQNWAATQNNLGNALRDQASASEGAEHKRLLGEAVSAYRAALEVLTRQDLPQNWAMTQNNLGLALQRQASASEGAERPRLLGEAVSAYRAALEVRTRKALPQDWAMTQNNLGAALSDQALASGGAERIRLLKESIVCYQDALSVWTKEHFPSYHQMAQNGLSKARRLLAEAEGKADDNTKGKAEGK